MAINLKINELNSLLNWEVITDIASAQANNIFQDNIEIFKTFDEFQETTKRNKANVLRLLDDIKINCNVTLELLPFDDGKRIFRVNESAKSESERYTFLFSAKKYSELFLLLQGFIIGLAN